MKTTGYMELYETRKLLEDLLWEAASYRDYKDPTTGQPRIDKETGEPVLTREEFDKVCAIDPTPTKAYCNWLVPQFVKIKREAKKIHEEEPIRLFFEDQARLAEAFKVMEEVKRVKPTGVNLDIMSYKTLADFEAAMEPYKKKENLTTKSSRSKDVDLLYEDDTWKILIPRSWDAARKYGTFTHWCTAVGDSSGEGHYKRYSGQGPLIIIWEKTKPLGWPSKNQCPADELEARLVAGKGPPTPPRNDPGYPSFKYQVHLASDQFKGATDNEVGAENRMKILKALPEGAQEALSKAGLSMWSYELISIFSYDYKGTIDGKILRNLMAHGADPHIKNEAVLKWAVANNDTEMADWLIKDKNTDRKVLADMVTEAAGASNFEMVEKIVNIVGPDAINANGGRAFVAATRYPIDNEDNAINEKVKKAVRANADLPRDRRVPVGPMVEQLLGAQGINQYNALSEKVAVFYEKATPIIHYFIERGADPNSQNGEALANLCKWSNEHVLGLIEYLLGKGANVNINSSLPYWTAFNNCRPKVLQLLIASGGKANVVK